jgi:hypothetical protein
VQCGLMEISPLGWGEFETTYDNPGFQKIILEGVKWALGMAAADVTPKPLPKAATLSK